MSVPDSILNKTITSVTIHGRYVGPYAFYEQTKLSSVSGRNIYFVDINSFNGCTSLTTSSLDFTKLKYIGYGAFKGCTGLSGTLTLSNVTCIEGEAFNGCTNLTRIELGQKMCVLSTVLTIPESVTTIAVPSEYVDAYKTYEGWNEYANKIVAK